ncbi:MAG: DUF3108 domain-containing protein [Flavobacteriales bacterium]
MGAQNKACISQNTATCAGEIITYKISYNVGNLWIGAGEVTFEVKLETYRKRPVYHIISTGKTYKSYDWFFKVRDCYETYCDTSTLLPLRFKQPPICFQQCTQQGLRFLQEKGQPTCEGHHSGHWVHL